jgi:uncharacterized protein
VSIFVLALTSFGSWFISTLAGGGAPLILIPVIGSLLGSAAVPPVITVGMLLGHCQRLFLYWRSVSWQLMWWYLPGAIFGAGLGAFVFTHAKLEWVSILLALFLIISIASYAPDREKPLFKVRLWYFLPAGFIFAFLSGLIGSTGPMLNPFYLNYGLNKEETIATKSAQLLIVHIVKIIAYTKFGVLTLPYLGYGLLIGLAAFPGNWLGQIALERVSEQRFRQLLTSFVALSGILILWQQRKFLSLW